MTTLRKTLLSAGACTLLVLGACGTEGDEASETPTVPEVFDGTPEEYDEAMAACYEEHGITAEVVPGGGISTSSTHSTEEYINISNSCNARLYPVTKCEDMTDAQWDAEYEWREEQFRCLVDGGFITGEPITIDEYKEIRMTSPWSWTGLDEIDDVDTLNEAVAACPFTVDQ